MEIERLVKMANDIGAFFETDKNADRAAAGVADHLKRFWDPRMRRQILEYFDEKEGKGLKKVVLDALRTHGHDIAPMDAAPRG